MAPVSFERIKLGVAAGVLPTATTELPLLAIATPLPPPENGVVKCCQVNPPSAVEITSPVSIRPTQWARSIMATLMTLPGTPGQGILFEHIVPNNFVTAAFVGGAGFGVVAEATRG